MKRAFQLTSVFALILGLSAVVHADETKGTIKSIDTSRHEVVLKGTIKDTIYELTKNGSVWLDGTSSKLSEFRADDQAIIVFEKQGEHMMAYQIRVLRNYKEATGTVADIFTQKREVTLKGTVKNTTYELNKDGTVYLNGKKASLSDIREGDEVRVTYEQRGDHWMASDFSVKRK